MNPGFNVSVRGGKLSISIPVDTLVCAFNYCPDLDDSGTDAPVVHNKKDFAKALVNMLKNDDDLLENFFDSLFLKLVEEGDLSIMLPVED